MIGNETSGLIILNPSRFVEACIHALKKETSKLDAVPRLHEGMSDGGAPYTREEHDAMWRKAEREDVLKENERMRSLLRSLWSVGAYAQKVETQPTRVEDDDNRRCVVGYDFAPLSFGWSEQVKVNGEWKTGTVGGLIYHQSSDTWSVHT